VTVQSCRMPVLSTWTFRSVLRLSFLSNHRRPALPPSDFLLSVHHGKCSPPLARLHHLPKKNMPFKPRTQDRIPSRGLRYLTLCVSLSLLSPDRPPIRQIHHTLCERSTSSAVPQVEAVDDEIFGLSSSSSLFFPLTTDRDIFTKKMQTTNPQPADAAP
jgi:hypothetical protein